MQLKHLTVNDRSGRGRVQRWLPGGRDFCSETQWMGWNQLGKEGKGTVLQAGDSMELGCCMGLEPSSVGGGRASAEPDILICAPNSDPAQQGDNQHALTTSFGLATPCLYGISPSDPHCDLTSSSLPRSLLVSLAWVFP
jgi:hypothetical protein